MLVSDPHRDGSDERPKPLEEQIVSSLERGERANGQASSPKGLAEVVTGLPRPDRV